MTDRAPIEDVSRNARRVAWRAIGIFAAVQAILVALVVVADRVRRHRNIRAQRAGYPWERYPAIELDDGDGEAQIFSDGRELFEQMLADIAAAHHTIELETYIWKADVYGQRFLDAIVERARAGVEVRVVYDWFANLVVDREFFARFPRDVLQVLTFRPIDGIRAAARPRTYLRDHRKLLVIDGETGYVGGFNFGDVYASARWRDTHLRLTGPSVRELQNAFVDFWNLHCGTANLAELPDVPLRMWQPDVVVHRNDPDLRIFPIRGVYLEAIDRASRHIYLTAGYFVPDRAFRRALTEASNRGVQVRVLLPRNSNHVVADWLARRWFDELLAAGVRFFLYEDMIHSKTATIDGVWSTIGTANIDRFSLLGNYEVNVEIHNQRLARQMEAMFQLDCTYAEELLPGRWAQRPTRNKLVERGLVGMRWLV